MGEKERGRTPVLLLEQKMVLCEAVFACEEKSIGKNLIASLRTAVVSSCPAMWCLKYRDERWARF